MVLFCVFIFFSFLIFSKLLIYYGKFVGDTNGTFYIKNTSHSRKFLLYKIRRSEPQLVSFYPKHGIVKPGDVHDIEINLVNAKVIFVIFCVCMHDMTFEIIVLILHRFPKPR